MPKLLRHSSTTSARWSDEAPHCPVDLRSVHRVRLGRRCESGGVMGIVPIDYKTACDFVRNHHRHHLPPQGWKYGIGLMEDGNLVGVVTIGRPVARHYDDGLTLEVTRCCTDGTKNACSQLYGAARRSAFALGYRRLITYTLQTEAGTSLVAAGYRVIGTTSGGSWNCDSRPRIDKHPTQKKICWEA